MNHSELIKSIASKTRESQALVKLILDELAATIQEAVRTDNEVTLQGVAKFSRAHREAREGRNPATGEKIHIAAKNVPDIKALKPLKEAANS